MSGLSNLNDMGRELRSSASRVPWGLISLLLLITVSRVEASTSTADSRVGFAPNVACTTNPDAAMGSYLYSSCSECWHTVNVHVLTDHSRKLGRPCCVSWGPDRVDCFVTGAGNVAEHFVHGVLQTRDGFGREMSLGEVECVSRAVGHIAVFIRQLSRIRTNTYSGGRWGPWKTVGNYKDVPSCLARDQTHVNCMMRGNNNHGYEFHSSATGWSAPVDKGHNLAYPIAAASSGTSTHADFFVVDSNNELRNIWWAQRFGWSGWGNKRGSVRGVPSVIHQQGVGYHVFVLGLETGVKYITSHRPGVWSRWQTFPGSFGSPPECLTTGNGHIHCFIADGKLARNSYDGSAWTGWIYGDTGDVFDKPSCVNPDRNIVRCMTTTFPERYLVEISYSL